MVFFNRILSLVILTAMLQMAKGQNLTFVSNELIVQLEYQKDIQKVIDNLNSQNTSADLKVIKPLVKSLNIWLIGFNETRQDAWELKDKCFGHPDVFLAQFNHTNVTRRDTVIPNDPDFGNLWAYLNDGANGSAAGADISATVAWDITTGGLTASGDSIVVAVVDGGFDLNHEDLNFWKNYSEIPGNGIDDDNNGYIDDYAGWNAQNSNGNITSDMHGTHVSGTIGAIGNNSIGVVGVNWNVKVMPIIGSSGNESVVVEAYGFAYDHRKKYNETNGDSGAFVVSTNSSFGVDFGDPANYPIWCNFYDSLGAVGILSAGATANQNTDVDVDGDIPTACPSDYMIAVTNTTANDQKNGGAAYGLTTIDIGAPGTGIYSTTPNNQYGNSTGTSMATPQIAGTIGLMYSAICPDMLSDYAGQPDSIALLVRNYLLSDGYDTISDLMNKTVTGGRLNLYKALKALRSYGCDTTDWIGIHSAIANKNNVELFPNPVSDVLYINYKGNLLPKGVTISDSKGTVVKNVTITQKGTHNLEISSLDLPKGLYFIEFSYQNTPSEYKRFVKF